LELGIDDGAEKSWPCDVLQLTLLSELTRWRHVISVNREYLRDKAEFPNLKVSGDNILLHRSRTNSHCPSWQTGCQSALYIRYSLTVFTFTIFGRQTPTRGTSFKLVADTLGLDVSHRASIRVVCSRVPSLDYSLHLTLVS
jgi:hypothetical protein